MQPLTCVPEADETKTMTVAWPHHACMPPSEQRQHRAAFSAAAAAAFSAAAFSAAAFSAAAAAAFSAAAAAASSSPCSSRTV